MNTTAGPASDLQETTIHSEESLPRDVMVLTRLNDLRSFMKSDYDLAVCNMDYPDDYDERIGNWLAKRQEESGRYKNWSDFQAEISPESSGILAPFSPILRFIDGELGLPLRLTMKMVSDQMCPLLHVDKLQLRFIVTLRGPGTEWFQDKDVNRKNLGKSGRKPIVLPDSYIQQVGTRQVAVLKGSRFPGSKGLVHRSPSINPEKDDPRFFVRIDFGKL